MVLKRLDWGRMMVGRDRRVNKKRRFGLGLRVRV